MSGTHDNHIIKHGIIILSSFWEVDNPATKRGIMIDWF